MLPLNESRLFHARRVSRERRTPSPNHGTDVFPIMTSSATTSRFARRELRERRRAGSGNAGRGSERPVLSTVFDEWSVLYLPPEVAESLFLCIDSTRQALEDLGAAPLEPEVEARLLPSERIARVLVARGIRVPEWDAVLALCELIVSVWDRKAREAAARADAGAGHDVRVSQEPPRSG